MLNSGQEDSYSYLAMRHPLDRDDFLRIALKFKVSPVIKMKESPSVEDHKVNGFFVQFTSTAEPLTSSFTNGEIMTFHGLVLMFVSHHDQDDHTYHLTYRYFDRPTQVRRAYIDILFDEIGLDKNKDKGCTVTPGEHDLEWVIDMDFEKEKRLRLNLRSDPNAPLRECFAMDGLSRYVDHNSNYLNIFSSMGSEFTFAVWLKEAVFSEKKHRLDVKESLHVSHELAAEIFDKVKTFSQILNDDKQTLAEVGSGYRELADKTGRLETYMQDLFRGTRRFEEHIVESITKFQAVNPETLPKMMKVKVLLDSLQYRQDRIFQRLVSIKGLMAAKRVFRKARKMLKRVELSFKELSDDISSDQFNAFFAKIRDFVEVVGRLDLKNFVTDVT